MIQLKAENGAGVTVFASFAAHGHPAAQIDRLEILGDKGAIRLDGPQLDCAGASPAEQTYDLAVEYQGSYNRTIAHFVQSLRDNTPFETAPQDNLETLAAGRGLLSAVWLGGFAMKPQESLPEVSALTREEEQAEVIRRLEEDIIFGRFAPGSRLVEDTLMTRYGASRHFVRQGLFQLERQGIVLREKNIGATVRFYSAEEVRQIYEVREMLTRQAALMIALPAPAKPDRTAERVAAAILRQGGCAGSARHP